MKDVKRSEKFKKKGTVLFAIIFYLVSAPINLFSQDSESFYKHEAGIDAFFMNRWIPFQQNIGVNAPYFLSYRRYKDSSKYRRIGLSFSISGQLEDFDSDLSNSSAVVSFNTRIGNGRCREIYNNIELHFGTDFLPEFSVRVVETEDLSPDEMTGGSSTSIRLGFGGGPFVGVQYNFNDRIGIYTEAAFYVKMNGNRSSQSFNDPGSENFTDLSFNFNTSFLLPGAIVLYFKF